MTYFGSAGKFSYFVIICETVETMDFLCVPWRLESAKCLQRLEAPSARFFCLAYSKVLGVR